MSAELNLRAFVTVKRESGEYSFVCANNANLVECYQAWCEIGDWMAEKIRQDVENRKPKDMSEEIKKEE